MIPILVEIHVEDDNQAFNLNSEEYSAYPNEEEILLQEGIEYVVHNVES